MILWISWKCKDKEKEGYVILCTYFFSFSWNRSAVTLTEQISLFQPQIGYLCSLGPETSAMLAQNYSWRAYLIWISRRNRKRILTDPIAHSVGICFHGGYVFGPYRSVSACLFYDVRKYRCKFDKSSLAQCKQPMSHFDEKSTSLTRVHVSRTTWKLCKTSKCHCTSLANHDKIYLWVSLLVRHFSF